MGGLWRNQDGTRSGKYLVTRRDGTVPDFEWLVLGSRDLAAPAGLRGYAAEAEKLGYDSEYVRDVRALADSWEQALKAGGPVGDPDAPRHRHDDPATVSRMPPGRSA